MITVFWLNQVVSPLTTFQNPLDLLTTLYSSHKSCQKSLDTLYLAAVYPA